MSIFAITLLLTVLLAVVIAAVVGIGMQGYYRDRSPRLAKGLATAAKHLNGDAKVPSALDNLLSTHS